MYTVYRHYNRLTNKSYIGMTSLEPKRRWDSGWGYKDNLRMWNDIQESDWNKDWEHSIIGQFENKDEALNVEEMFILLFDSTNGGYNTSAYSSHSCKHSEETKRKIRENNPSKAVIQLSKDGKFIAEYPSIREASRQTGCNNSHICECCKGERKSASGYIWRYKEI